MFRHLLFFLLCFPCLYAQAQAPALQWQRSLGGTQYDAAGWAIQASDSSYIVLGATESADGDIGFNHGWADCWIAKLSPSGALLWERSLGGSYGDYGIFLQQTFDGGYIFTGYSVSSDGDLTMNHGSVDAWVVKLSDTGGIEWQRSMGGSSFDVLNCVRQTGDSGYILAGWSKSADGDLDTNNGDADVWVVRLNKAGSTVWSKTYGGTQPDQGTTVSPTSDGGFAVSGFARSDDGDISGNHGAYDIWLGKLSAAGQLIWQKSYGGTKNELNGDHASAGALGQTYDGGYVIAGWSASSDGDLTSNYGDYDFWVLRLDDTGRIVWQRSLGGAVDDNANCLLQTTDTGYIIAGTSGSLNGDVSGMHGLFDFWMIRLDDSGSLEWQQCYGGTGKEVAYSIAATRDTGFILAGFTNLSSGQVTGVHGDHDIWVTKLKTPVIDAVAPLEVAEIHLVPNPAKSRITLTGIKEPITLRISDLSGRLLLRTNEMETDISGLAPGLYIAEILRLRDGRSLKRAPFIRLR